MPLFKGLLIPPSPPDQRLDLCKLNASDSDAVRGQIVGKAGHSWVQILSPFHFCTLHIAEVVPARFQWVYRPEIASAAVVLWWTAEDCWRTIGECVTYKHTFTCESGIKRVVFQNQCSRHTIYYLFKQCVCLCVCLGLSLRDVSVKSRFPILTLLVQRGAGTVGLTRPVRRTVFRCSESEGRTPGAMATPLRIDLRGTNRLTYQRDMVSPAVLEFTYWSDQNEFFM